MLSKQALKSVFKRPSWASKMTQWSKILVPSTHRKEKKGREDRNKGKEGGKEGRGLYTLNITGEVNP